MSRNPAMASNVGAIDAREMAPPLGRTSCHSAPSTRTPNTMRLFFHLFDGTDVILDREGVEVDSLHQAEDAISADVAELQREFPIEERRGWVLRVTDGSGA